VPVRILQHHTKQKCSNFRWRSGAKKPEGRRTKNQPFSVHFLALKLLAKSWLDLVLLRFPRACSSPRRVNVQSCAQSSNFMFLCFHNPCTSARYFLRLRASCLRSWGLRYLCWDDGQQWWRVGRTGGGFRGTIDGESRLGQNWSGSHVVAGR
jgi:hypothetical protein